MQKEKKTRKYRRYDAEFKENALSLLSDGRSISSVASSLGISENLLYNWRSKSKEVKRNSKESELAEELKGLKKQLKEVEQERDILKKALSIFSRAS